VSLKWVALAAGNIPGSMSLSLFADSRCTIHFFKNQSVFSLYKALNKVVGQSSKEGTSFTILGTGNIEFKCNVGSGGCLEPHTSEYDDVVFSCIVGYK